MINEDEDEEEINTSGVAFLVALSVILVSLLYFRVSRSAAYDQIIEARSKSEDRPRGVTFDEHSNEVDVRSLIILKAPAEPFKEPNATTDTSPVAKSIIDDKKSREEDARNNIDLKEDAVEDDAKVDDTSSSDSKLEQEEVTNDNTWRCVCENGFLPPGMLKSFTSFEAVTRMSTGNCYHKAS